MRLDPRHERLVRRLGHRDHDRPAVLLLDHGPRGRGGLEGEGATTEAASGSQTGRANLGQLLFDLLDTNADGAIAADEFSAAVRARRPSATDADISGLFAQLDLNDDESVTLDELQPKPRMRNGAGRGRGGRMERPGRGQFGPGFGGMTPEERQAEELAPEETVEP